MTETTETTETTEASPAPDKLLPPPLAWVDGLTIHVSVHRAFTDEGVASGYSVRFAAGAPWFEGRILAGDTRVDDAALRQIQDPAGAIAHGVYTGIGDMLEVALRTYMAEHAVEKSPIIRL